MKSKPKRGRPKLPKNQTRVAFPIRLSPDERKAVEAAARRAGKKSSEWARNQLLDGAKPAIS